MAGHRGTCAALHPSRPPHTLGIAILGRPRDEQAWVPTIHTGDLEIAGPSRIRQRMHYSHTEQSMSSATWAISIMRFHVREILEPSIWHYNTSSSSRLFESTKDWTKEHFWKQRCTSEKQDTCKEVALPLLAYSGMTAIYNTREGSRGWRSAIHFAIIFRPS